MDTLLEMLKTFLVLLTAAGVISSIRKLGFKKLCFYGSVTLASFYLFQSLHAVPAKTLWLLALTLFTIFAVFLVHTKGRNINSEVPFWATSFCWFLYGIIAGSFIAGICLITVKNTMLDNNPYSLFEHIAFGVVLWAAPAVIFGIFSGTLLFSTFRVYKENRGRWPYPPEAIDL